MGNAQSQTAAPPRPVADDCRRRPGQLPPTHPPSQQEPAQPHSLADLGYEARLYSRRERTELWCVIRQPGSDSYVAILQIFVDGGTHTATTTTTDHRATTLVVPFVDMESDVRGEHARPRLRQLLAVFWTDPSSSLSLGRDLGRLRRIAFRNVTERHTRAVVRDRVCRLVGVPYDAVGDRPRGDIVLEAPERGGALAPWTALCQHSRLVRSAVGLLRDYPGVAGRGEGLVVVVVVQMKVLPAWDEAGRAHGFDLEILFGPG